MQHCADSARHHLFLITKHKLLHFHFFTMVDYSKWDKFAADLSDDDEQEGILSQSPRVTAFEGDSGRSFNIGPSGTQLLPEPPTKSITTTTTSSSATVITASSSAAATTSSYELLSSRNGGVTNRCTWCQDRSEVILRKELPLSTKAGDIQVTFDRIESVLKVITKNSSRVMEGTVRYKFELNDEELCPIQWELVTITDPTAVEHRVLEIALKKLSPIPGAIIWWKNVFVDDPEIDVTTIPDRQMTAASKEVSGAWDEAHRLFRERVATREPITIDLGDDAEAEEAEPAQEDDDFVIVERPSSTEPSHEP
jgi:hypothetical protein